MAALGWLLNLDFAGSAGIAVIWTPTTDDGTLWTDTTDDTGIWTDTTDDATGWTNV